MTTRNTYVKARINDELKAHVNEIFARIGINASDAINLFYSYVELHNGLPFEVKIPNKKTEDTFKNTDEGKDLYNASSVEDLFNQLED